MIREDWAQNGMTMVPQSAVIRAWIGDPPYLFAVPDLTKFSDKHRSADVDAARYIAPETATRKVFDIADLARLEREDKVIDHAVVVLHPFDEPDLDVLRRAVDADSVARLFVLAWAPIDMVRTWLDGRGAVNLHTGATAGQDPLMVAAAKLMVNEEYNGLSSGIGKTVVVELVCAFRVAGYPPDADNWLGAYFAAGGTFRHAASVKKLVTEIKAGTKHRVPRRYRDNIFEIIKAQVESDLTEAQEGPEGEADG
ncbi:hypothetical protein [Nocardioides sp. WS12]|uniref:hypothetical protein n=1 Tax=Nocardioides sp. WS12 TaxID=2486272 RepID=UPI00191F1E51|nr:hypothetical protein [Nocardioides sp. WS12]